MTIDIAMYDTSRLYVMDGTITLPTDTLKVALLSSSYNPAPGVAAWAASISYALGTIVTYGGRYYEAIVAGVSSGVVGNMPTQRGITLVDNTVTWLCWGYSPPSTHSVFADVSANEITGTGYTAGGTTLSGQTLTISARTVTFTIPDIEWASVILTAKYAVLYKSGTANGHVNPVICYFLLDNTNQSVSVVSLGKFSISLGPTGLIKYN